METQVRSGFVQSRLPWLIAAAALVVYGLSLNRWASLSSLPNVTGVAARELTPPISEPVRFLLFLPFRWLPVAWQPVGLNLFAAVCAALTLGLLARSVALLPQDRTREQRQRERSEHSLLSIPAAWAPPLFATLVCGLQLSFWEHATAATGEMLDLLFFAYVVRCLLEFRIDQRESWLTRSALVYGIAATNNYAMIGIFPVYVAALLWIRGRSFFNFRFMARMFGWGTAGLTLYLLLPLLNAASAEPGFTFWQSLRFELAGQKNVLSAPELRSIAFWAALTSLLPLLIMGIRWPGSFGDTSAAGAVLTRITFHVVHGVFFAAGIWVAFDAPFCARTLVDRKLLQQMDDPFSGISFLTLYYLGAICLGYFAGYFLLVFGKETAKTWQKVPAAARLLNRAVTAVIWAVVLAVPAGLLYKNGPLIQASDGLLLREFARLTALGLPARDAIALCDQPYILSLVQTDSRHSRPVLADTRLLPYTAYQQSLHKQFSARWPEPPPAETTGPAIDPAYLTYEISALARSNEVYYLHPSFGYYFEPLYLIPHGLVYQLAPYATNAITPPSLTGPVIGENLKFWSQARPELERVTRLAAKKINDARVVGRWYSRALNWWGVELQKLGRLPEAAQAFELARKLNPQNVSAEINLNFNQALRARVSRPADTDKSLEEKFDRYRTWNALLAVNGPIDDPIICFRLGQTFVSQGLFRQSALQFTRVLQLDPENLDARLWLAQAFLAGQIPDKALEITTEIRARQSARPLTSTNLVELIRLEAMAHFNKGEVETAEKTLREARRQYPQNDTLLDTLTQVYVRANRLTNALAVLDEQLKLKPDASLTLLNKAYVCMKLEAYEQAKAAVGAVLRKDPDNVQALLDKGAIFIQTKLYKDALAPLDHVLKLQPNNEIALMNRAIANLQGDQLDAARRDYETLQKRVPTLHRVYYGLGEIAFRCKDVPAAIRHYETYLKYAPPDTDEAKQIAERLKQLKASAGR